MRKYQEALDKIKEFHISDNVFRPKIKWYCEYEVHILQELVDRATPKKTYYERGELCCKACGEPTDYDNAYCGYCGQKLDD